MLKVINPLSTNPTKWSNTLKQFAGNLATNCLSVFDHFVKLALKGLRASFQNIVNLKAYINLFYTIRLTIFGNKKKIT